MIAVALCTFAEPHQSMVDDKGPLFTLGVHIDCAASLFALGQAPLGQKLTFAWQQAYYTQIGKQRLMESLAEARDLEAVVFIDGDMAFSPKDFEDLVKVGRATQGVVGAFYPSRQKIDTVIGAVASGDTNDYASPVPVPATYVGLGFCWVPSGVFHALKSKPWVDVVHQGGGKWMLEDEYFSRKVLEETQYKIWGICLDGVSHAFHTRRNMGTLMVQGGM